MDVAKLVEVADLNGASYGDGKLNLEGVLEFKGYRADINFSAPVQDKEFGELVAGIGSWWAAASKDGNVETKEIANGLIALGPLVLSELLSRNAIPEKFVGHAQMVLGLLAAGKHSGAAVASS